VTTTADRTSSSYTPIEARRYRRMMAALVAAGVATFAELYAIQSVLPDLARSMDVGASDAALTVSAATTGLAVGVFGWTWLADRIGRLPAMRWAVLGAVVLGVLGSLAPDLVVLLPLRFLSGMALGAVPVLAVAYVHEVLTGWRAAAAAAAYISGTTVGGAAGRLVAGPLAPVLGWRGALLAVSAVSLLAALVFLALAPATPRPAGAPGPQLSRIRAALSRSALLRLYLQALLLTGCFVAVYNFLGFRLETAPFGFDAAAVSLIFLTYGAGTVTARLAGRWLPRIGFARTTLIGMAAMLAGLVLLLADNVAALLAGLVLFTGGFFIAHAAAAATTGSAAHPDYRSQAGAVYNTCFYLGSGLGGWLLGLAFDHAGWPVLTLFAVALLLAAAALPTATLLRVRMAEGRTHGCH